MSEPINDNVAEISTGVPVRQGDRVLIAIVDGEPTVVSVEGAGDELAEQASRAEGYAAGAHALAEAVDRKAEEAKADIGALGDRLDGVLTVDATYSETPGDAGSYTFTGYVFRAGVDVTDDLMASDASKFSWTRKTEDGEVQIASGTRSVTVAKGSLGYGGSVTFYYDAAQDSALATTASAALQSTDSLQLMAAASADSVRVDELPQGTVSDSAQMMLWGTSTFRASVGDISEHVVSHVKTLSNMQIEGMLTD